VPIRPNPPLRPSRLMRSLSDYVAHSAITIIRAYTTYRPLRAFLSAGSLVVLAGVLLGARFVYYFVMGNGAGHIQSLILASVLLVVGFQIGLIGLVADLIGTNRKLLEEVLYRVRRLEQEQPVSDAER
jgi:hypothetical protein